MTSEDFNRQNNQPDTAAKQADPDDMPGLYVLAIYHGDTGHSVLAYYGDVKAELRFLDLKAAMTEGHSIVEVHDDIGTMLLIKADDIRAVRLVTQGGQRKLQVAGNVENVRNQQATSRAMQAAFGQDPTAVALVHPHTGQPIKPRRGN